jgi:hypothetical protein
MALAACMALVLTSFFLWPRHHDLSYECQTIDEWFKRYSAARMSASVQPIAPAELAFRAMGTNAVSYLARRIIQPQDHSRLIQWRVKYHRQIPRFLTPLLPPVPGSRFAEGMNAAELLAAQIKPPGRLLIPLITPALQSTNSDQRCMAFAALRGIGSDFELARPHLVRGLKDQDSRVQIFAAMAIRWSGPHGRWAVTNLVEAAQTTNLNALGFALQSLNALGTNALPVLPMLTEILDKEKDVNRRQALKEAMDQISRSGSSP